MRYSLKNWERYEAANIGWEQREIRSERGGGGKGREEGEPAHVDAAHTTAGIALVVEMDERFRECLQLDKKMKTVASEDLEEEERLAH